MGDIAADKAGNLYLAGGFAEAQTLGSISLDPGYCLIKLDPSGNVVWAKQLTGEGSASGKCVKTDANVPWTVSDTSSWLSSSRNGNTVEVDYLDNPYPVGRTATILIEGDGCLELLTVVQDPASCVLTVAPGNLMVDHEAGQTKLHINSNSDWSFSENMDWLTATKTHPDTLTVNYTANNSVIRTGTMTIFNACLSTMDVGIEQDGVIGISSDPTQLTQFSIYPNPTNGIICLESGSRVDGKLTVTLVDDTGKKVFSRAYKNVHMNHPIEIDLGAHPTGIYILQISTAHVNRSYSVLLRSSSQGQL